MALPKFKGTLLLKSLVASCVLISSVGAESAAPTSPACGNTDPSFCEAELKTLAEKIFKCGWPTFVEKCKGTCGYCPGAGRPPPEINCAGLADDKECTIKVKKCQKKPPKSMKKCQKNCKKDAKKKAPLCQKTCCKLGFRV